MQTQIKTHVNLEILTTNCTYLVGYKSKAHATRAKQGFKTVEEATSYSEQYGIYKTYYRAQVYFKDVHIVSSEEQVTEQKALKQAYALAKEYFHN